MKLTVCPTLLLSIINITSLFSYYVKHRFIFHLRHFKYIHLVNPSSQTISMDNNICNSKLQEYLVSLISKSVDCSSQKSDSIESLVLSLVNQLIVESTETFKKENCIDIINDIQRKSLNEKIRTIGTAASKSFKADPLEFKK